MARRHRYFDDLIQLPWWVSLILASLVYVGLKYGLVSIEFQSPGIKGGAMGLSNAAGIISAMFVLAGLISAVHAWRRGDLLDRQTSIQSIQSVSWKDFEYLVSEAFRRQGYAVKENAVAGADGGVDLVLEKDGRRTLVQCKNWQSRSVGVSIVRELYGVMAAEGADGGIVVCSGHYTQDAKDFAAGKALELVDGPKLTRLIGNLQKAPNIRSVSEDKSCPKCGGEMVMRTAKKGQHTGSSFRGCVRYPKCRGIRSI